ncbi:hypothetical protein O1L60_18520 [Streptomyces diastatochromogenes]|nr:hypothetical protein [Streptomyces diastatochromogenes]
MTVPSVPVVREAGDRAQGVDLGDHLSAVVERHQHGRTPEFPEQPRKFTAGRRGLVDRLRLRLRLRFLMRRRFRV